MNYQLKLSFEKDTDSEIIGESLVSDKGKVISFSDFVVHKKTQEEKELLERIIELARYVPKGNT